MNDCKLQTHLLSRTPDCLSLLKKQLSTASPSVIALDLETTGLDPLSDRITVIAIAVIDSEGFPHAFIVDRDIEKSVSELKAIIEDSSVPKILHNAKFDWKFFWHHFGVSISPILDTMQASRIIDNGLTGFEKGWHALGGVAERYLGVTLDKDEDLRQSFTGSELTERQISYVAQDVIIPLRLMDAVKEHMDEGLLSILDLEGSCIPFTGKMELNGFLIDQKKREELEMILTTKLEGLREAMPDFKGGRLNPNSPIQVSDYIYEKIDRRLDATDEANLKKLRKTKLADFANNVLKARQTRKFLSTYVKRLHPDKLPKDGRLRGEFDALGTTTGRFSSRKPNLQNIPRRKEFRELFSVSEGNVLVKCDYSQIELRIAAELSKDERMLQAFSDGSDLHRETASKMFGKTCEEITEMERKRAKAVNFGMLYNMGPSRLVKDGVCETKSEGKRFINAFFSLYPGIRDYQKELKAGVDYRRLINKGRVEFRTPRSGRRRWMNRLELMYRSGTTRMNVLYNTPIQGLAGDGMKQAMAELWNEIKDRQDIRPVTSVHDELVVECPEPKANEVAQTIKNAMSRGMEHYLKEVPIEVDSSISATWWEG